MAPVQGAVVHQSGPHLQVERGEGGYQVGGYGAYHVYSRSKAGEYRLGRVIITEMDEDGIIGTCTVKYSLKHVK